MSSEQKYDQVIYDAAIKEGLSPLLATYMVAQAKHEAAMYTSGVFTACNNAFGYKYVGQALAEGPCNGSPEGDNYAKYKSVQDSATEVARWIKRRMSQFESVSSPEEYAIVLERNGYFGGSLSAYQKALSKFWYPIKGMMNTAVTKYPTETILTGVAFFSLAGFYMYQALKKK